MYGVNTLINLRNTIKHQVPRYKYVVLKFRDNNKTLNQAIKIYKCEIDDVNAFEYILRRINLNLKWLFEIDYYNNKDLIIVTEAYNQNGELYWTRYNAYTTDDGSDYVEYTKNNLNNLEEYMKNKEEK